MEIKEIDALDIEDQVRLCVPPKESPNHPKFERGVEEKVEWLREKQKEYGYLGHMAYNGDGKPIGFVEFVPAKDSPVPIADITRTALITCIYLIKNQGHGIGTLLLQATLKRLWKIGASQVKTLVSRSPQWINNGIYRKHGFQLEKTFYKLGSPEPLDLLTLRLDGPQPEITPEVQHFKPLAEDKLPLEVLYFHSAQCPFTSALYINHIEAIKKFDKGQVSLKIIDSWKEPETAKRYASMYSDTFINGRAPFFAPPKQEDIEKEIQKEINRVLAFRK